MATPDFGGQFRGQIQSRGFNQISSIDESKKILQQTQGQVRNVNEMAKRAVDRSKEDAMRLKQDYDRDRYQLDNERRQMQVDQAFNNANIKAFQGLLSLSKTGMAFYAEQQKKQEQEKLLDMELEANGFGEEALPADTDAIEQQERAVEIESQATGQVIDEVNDGSVEGASISNQLEQGTSYPGLRAIKGNLYAARAEHGAFLNEAIANLSPEDLPATRAEAVALMRSLNREFIREAGLQGADKNQLKSILLGTMSSNTQNKIASLTVEGIKADRKANGVKADNLASTLVDNWKKTGLSAQEIMNQMTKEMAFGGHGFGNKYSKQSNEAALAKVLNEAVQNGDTTLINELRKVQQRPGIKGTEFGKKYDHLFDKAEKQARQGAIDEFNLKKREKAVAMKEAGKLYYDDPSPENLRAFVNYLRFEDGSAEAIAEAKRLTSAGLNYDPQKAFELNEMKLRGQTIDQEMLADLLDRGVISQQEYKAFKIDAKEDESLKATRAFVKSNTSMLKSSLVGNVTAGSSSRITSGQMTSQLQADINNRTEVLKEDLAKRMYAHIRSNPALLEDRREMLKIQSQELNELLQRPEYKLDQDAGKGWSFMAPLSATGAAGDRLNAITIPGKPGVQDFSLLSTKDIFDKYKMPVSEMDPLKDRFLDGETLTNDVKAALGESGSTYSDRTKMFAKKLGMSEANFIDMQLKKFNKPSLAYLRTSGNEELPTAGFVHDIKNEQQGLNYLRGMGFPLQGAAYIASAISHESDWDGLREWGQVAGDGTSRNGGLISWAQWTNDPARLGAIERHFSRPIDQISESDQLAYMKKEMQTSYPKAYRIFNNPNSLPAQLQWAVENYWGFDKRYTGTRYSHAEKLIAAGN